MLSISNSGPAGVGILLRFAVVVALSGGSVVSLGTGGLPSFAVRSSFSIDIRLTIDN